MAGIATTPHGEIARQWPKHNHPEKHHGKILALVQTAMMAARIPRANLQSGACSARSTHIEKQTVRFVSRTMDSQ